MYTKFLRHKPIHFRCPVCAHWMQTGEAEFFEESKIASMIALGKIDPVAESREEEMVAANGQGKEVIDPNRLPSIPAPLPIGLPIPITPIFTWHSNMPQSPRELETPPYEADGPVSSKEPHGSPPPNAHGSSCGGRNSTLIEKNLLKRHRIYQVRMRDPKSGLELALNGGEVGGQRLLRFGFHLDRHLLRATMRVCPRDLLRRQRSLISVGAQESRMDAHPAEDSWPPCQLKKGRQYMTPLQVVWHVDVSPTAFPTEPAVDDFQGNYLPTSGISCGTTSGKTAKVR